MNYDISQNIFFIKETILVYCINIKKKITNKYKYATYYHINN